MHKAAQAPQIRPTTGAGGTIVEGGALMATAATQRQDNRGAAGASGGQQDGSILVGATDGNEALAKFLVQHKLAPEDVIQSSLATVQKLNGSIKSGAMGLSLLNEIVERGGADIESLLCGIIERTKFSYVPLEYYDVDRHVIRMLPEELTLRRLIVPFDVISRTVMIATANPFDSAGKEAAQSVLDYNIQWHIASPEAISKILTQAYRIEKTAPRREMEDAFAKPKEAPVFGDMPTSLPIPELKVSASKTPLSPPGDTSQGGPLPDTSDFRLKK
jgi:hypothetical protein